MESEYEEIQEGFDPTCFENDGFMQQIDDVISVENDIKDSREQKTRSLLKSDQCPITSCTVKESNRKLSNAISTLRRQNGEVTRENERLVKALEGNLDDERKEELTIAAIERPFVQSLKSTNEGLQRQIDLLQREVTQKTNRLTELETERSTFMTNIELNRKYGDKLKQYNELERRNAILIAKEKDLELKTDKLETKFDDLADQYNAKLDEMEHLKARIKNKNRAAKSKSHQFVPPWRKGKRKAADIFKFFK